MFFRCAVLSRYHKFSFAFPSTTPSIVDISGMTSLAADGVSVLTDADIPLNAPLAKPYHDIFDGPVRAFPHRF